MSADLYVAPGELQVDLPQVFLGMQQDGSELGWQTFILGHLAAEAIEQRSTLLREAGASPMPGEHGLLLKRLGGGLRIACWAAPRRL